MIKYIKLIRPEQYIKNLFLYLPLFFSFQLFDTFKLIHVTIGFVSFSLIASSIYIFNDINDINFDKNHPTKKNRPLASGDIPVKNAVVLMLFLVITGLIIGFLTHYHFFLISIIYIILNILYSIKLKHFSLIDITIIAIGFVLRIFAGAVIIKNIPSMWTILLTFMLALFLGIAKRRDDVILSAENSQTRKNVDGYNIDLINACMVLMATVTIVSYIMYTITPEVILRMKTDKLYLTVIFVILGFLRYLQLTLVFNNSGSPTKLLLKDLFLKGTLILWVFSFLFILYRDKIQSLFV